MLQNLIIDGFITEYCRYLFDIAIVLLCIDTLHVSNAASLPKNHAEKNLDLALLITELEDHLADKWLVFGLNLGLKIEELECIEANHPTNCQKCSTKLLISWWKQQQSPSWDQIVQALKKIRNEKLASTICEKYLTSEFQEKTV